MCLPPCCYKCPYDHSDGASCARSTSLREVKVKHVDFFASLASCPIKGASTCAQCCHLLINLVLGKSLWRTSNKSQCFRKRSAKSVSPTSSFHE